MDFFPRFGSVVSLSCSTIALRNVVLNGEDIGQIAIEALTPKVTAVVCS